MFTKICKNMIKLVAFKTILLTSIANGAIAAKATTQEFTCTKAGNFDIPDIAEKAKISGVYHKMKGFNQENSLVELDNESLWLVNHPEEVKKWSKGENLILTQNQLTFSTYRFSLVNVDRKSAVPASLVREPIPYNTDKNIPSFIKNVDFTNSYIQLNNGDTWLVYSSDQGTLHKFNEHDRLLIGVNSSSNDKVSAYILIDTAANTYVRAHRL